MRTSRTLLVSFALAVTMALSVGPLATVASASDDALPGHTLNLVSGISGVVGATDTRDAYNVQLQDDEELTIRFRGQPGGVVNLVVMSPTATSISGPTIASATSVDGAPATLYYNEALGKGRYYVVAIWGSGPGGYSTDCMQVTTDRELGINLNAGQRTVWMHTSRARDVWVIWVRKYRFTDVFLTDPAGAGGDFDLSLFTDDGTGQPNVLPVDQDLSANDSKSVNLGNMTMDPPQWGAGDYAPLYIVVTRASGSGDYTLRFNTEPAPAYYERVGGATRFQVATNLIIDSRWPFDEAVSDVVIASGDDAAAADPLSAAGLCWAYNAPLVLVSKYPALNSEAMMRLSDMQGFNGKVRAHIVGGTASIPPAVETQIRSALGGGSASVERIAGANRYDNAKRIAARMKSVRSDARSGVLVANGADASKFFDALSLSAISARTGMPICLVKQGSVPSESKSILTATAGSRIVAGGTASVSESVRLSMGGVRWSGPDRYTTANTVATNAIALGWLGRDNIGLASKLPDALSAGAAMGWMNGPIVLTQPTVLPSSTRSFLHAQSLNCERLWPVGGPMSVSDAVISSAVSVLQ